jgi:MFS family permease
VSATPWRQLAGSPGFPAVLVVSFGVWLHAADELMVSTITPAMVGDIGGAPFVSWLIALYETGSIMAGALSAYAVRRAGMRAAMAGAALVYMAGCLASALSPSMAAMLAGRTLQGFGGGAMTAVAFIAVYRIAGPALTAPVYALLSAIWGVSAFTGPLIGAGFADGGWWRGAFYLFAAQAAAFALFARARLPGGAAGEPVGASGGETGGAAELGPRLAALAASVAAIATAGVTRHAGPALLLLLAGAGALTLFLVLDNRAGRSRLMPQRPWSAGTAPGAAVQIALLLSVATTGLITYGPLLMARLHGFDAVASGLILMTESVGWSLVAIATANLKREREPVAILGGFVAVASGIGLLGPAIAGGSAAAIAICALLQGGGMGAAWAFFVRRATVLAGTREGDRVAAAIPTSQRLGYALGAAASGIIANASGFADSPDKGVALAANWRIFMLSLAPAVAGIAIAWHFLRFREEPWTHR